ncbi:MAG: hypothetical protein KKD31_17435 [Bacteroidetes bacterium]|nr:hypothetical protein [Bacteroidota bacterium]
MSGNVAEMTLDNYAVGGSWLQEANEVKVSSATAITVSPTTGFRPVFTFL